MTSDIDYKAAWQEMEDWLQHQRDIAALNTAYNKGYRPLFPDRKREGRYEGVGEAFTRFQEIKKLHIERATAEFRMREIAREVMREGKT